MVLCIAVGILIAILMAFFRYDRSTTGPRCGNCRYNLTGSQTNRCPECGMLFVDAGVLVGGARKRGKWLMLVVGVLFLGIGTTGILTAIAQVNAARRAVEAARAREAAVATFQANLLQSANDQSAYDFRSADDRLLRLLSTLSHSLSSQPSSQPSEENK